MLQNIREKTSGWIATILLGGIIIIFGVGFGLQDSLTPSIETFAAKVETPAKFLMFGSKSKEVSSEEFRRRFDMERQARRQREGEAFDAAAFETADNKRRVLDQLVDEALVELAAEQAGLAVSDSMLRKAILAVDAFKVDGKFDQNTYLLAIQGQGYSTQTFEQYVRSDLLKRMLSAEIAGSGLASEAELTSYLKLSQQQRDIRYVEIPVPPPPAAPTEAEIKQWYDSHAGQYRSPEQVAVEYVELMAASAEAGLTVDEAALRQRYEEEKARYTTLEQRKVAHILVAVAEKASADVIEAARKKALGLTVQARQPGADFSALARAHSDDLGSRDAGGDLGVMEEGVFGDAFDKAFKTLKPGQVSDPVRLPDGWHVVRYSELVPGSTRPFEEVRAEIEASYLESETERSFTTAAGKLLDAVAANSNSLEPAAKALGLTANRTSLFTRSSGDGFAALPAVRKAAFSEAQLVDREPSDLVEIAPKHVAVLRVIEHKPAAQIPLAQIRERVLADLQADRVAKAAKAAADALLARAAKGETLDQLATQLGQPIVPMDGITRNAPNPQLAAFATAVFSLPAPVAGQVRLATASMGPGRHVLLEVTAVRDGDLAGLDDTTRASLRKSLAQMRGDQAAREFIQSLRKVFKVTVVEDRM